MSAFFNSDGSFPLQFLIIFVVIFVVLAAIVLVFRRFSGKGMALSKSGPRGRQPRLGIVDIYELDRQRQLILLRRDNVEHLLLVGGPNDVIVERNINRGASARHALDDGARVEPLPEEPAIEPARPADPPAASAPPVFQPPVFQPPVFQPPVFQSPVYQPPVSDVPVPERPEARPPEPAANMSSVTADEAATRRNDPVEARPAVRPSRAEMIAAKVARRNPPPLANLKAEPAERPPEPTLRVDSDVGPRVDAPEAPAPEAPRAPMFPVSPVQVSPVQVSPEKPARPQPAPEPAPAVEPVVPVPPPLARPTNSRPVDAAILSDMARQLEEALRRPSAAVSPSNPAVAPAPPTERKAAVKPEPGPEPVIEDSAQSERPIDPMAAAMAAAPDVPSEPAPAVKPRAVGPVQDEPAPNEPAQSEPEPFLPAPPPPAQPVPPPPSPPAPPPEPAVSAQRKPPAASQNPFSVEEIEAEFARLLGRPLDKKN
ncbi:hypothetical protein [Methylobacterium sp. 77]|uniref:hypothetical protein n=1 Tax=Methylobacterium sp. 77 TaxID=1101192 RepID=UPI00037666DA|nr:hypothetical protein [Methylobacterium sp. 77]